MPYATEGDWMSSLVGPCSGNANLIGRKSIGAADPRRLAIRQTIGEMLQLSPIGITKALHQVWRDVVLSTGARQQQHRHMLVNADHYCALGAENLCTNIIAVEGITAHLDIPERSTRKAQVDDSIVDI